MLNLMFCKNDGNLYFASQPKEHDYSLLKAQGFTHVINLRSSAEGDFSPHAKICDELGLVYIQSSLMGPMGVDTTTVDLVNKVVSENKDHKLFIHCASANRTGIWYAIYLVQVEGMDVEDAIDRAFDTNNIRPPSDNAVRDYLEQSS